MDNSWRCVISQCCLAGQYSLHSSNLIGSLWVTFLTLNRKKKPIRRKSTTVPIAQYIAFLFASSMAKLCLLYQLSIRANVEPNTKGPTAVEVRPATERKP